MQREVFPQPDLNRRAPGASVARLTLVLLIVGLVVSVAFGALLVRLLEGWVRIVVLAVLGLLVLTGALIVWQTGRTFQAVAARRERTIVDIRDKRIIGVLAFPAIPGWDDRVRRDFVLPAGPHLLVVGPETVDTPAGQRAGAALADLIGRPPPPSGVYNLPSRAMLALLDDGDNGDDVSLWDLSAFFNRIDAGDENAAEEFYELQLHVQQLAMAAASSPRSGA